jgi:CheY-like chemotaxis protein
MNQNSLNILIVDDDKDDALMLLQAIQEILPSSNAYFESDGIAAWRFLKLNRAPDLVFLDLNMPLLYGLDCLKDIYNQDMVPNTPIVIYSASMNMKDIDACYNYGATFYMVKPACYKHLISLARQAISILGKPKSERVNKECFVLREAALITQ